MRRFLLLLLTVTTGIIFFAGSAAAKPKTRQQAQRDVETFLSQRGISLKVERSMARGQQEDSQESIYFFDVEGGNGFVIASGSDSTPAILGYTDSGSYDEETLPENMKEWLEGCKHKIEDSYFFNLGTTSSTRESNSNHTKISPLLETTWNQNDPYNMQCPIQPISKRRCVTGCVATAMAQIMYYHRDKSVNKTTKEISGYICKEDGKVDITVNTFPKGSFIDWNNMLESYNGSETLVQKNAVASLMAYCGAAVNMGYGTGSSEAYFEDVPIALINYFSYSESMHFEYKNSYSEKEWNEILYSELSNGNPIFLGAQADNRSEGHAFVCDGYDGDGYYHINWGWGGKSDGYYLLSAFNPDKQGIGAGGNGYNTDQIALIGAVPNVQTHKYTLKYVVDGNVYKVLTLYEGDIITPEPAPTKYGYTFSGWSSIPATMPAYDVTITGTFIKDSSLKCATPTINYKNGEISFSCSTEGVRFVSGITVADAKENHGAQILLTKIYTIRVYATKDGYTNSDEVTREIVIGNNDNPLIGDVDGNGVVNEADHVKLTDIIMKK